jgi:hypothetical protein
MFMKIRRWETCSIYCKSYAKTFPVLRLATFTTAKSFVPERLNFLINIFGGYKERSSILADQ